MKKIFLSLFVFSCCMVAIAQSNEYLQAAEKYFSKGDYYSASQYYEKYLAGGKAKPDAGFSPYAVSATSTSAKVTTRANLNRETVMYKLAESYRLLHFHEKAEPNYRQVLEKNAANFPLARYHYATTLRALARYDEAEKEFTTFMSEYKETDIYSENASREVANLRYVKEQMAKKDLQLYTVNKAPSALNSEGGNYAPVWMNNTLLFTSTRPVAANNAGTYVNRVYEADYSSGEIGNVVLSSLPQPKDVEQGVVSVTPDGNTMFLSRWVIGKGTKTATIYSSKKMGDKWGDPVPVTSINAAGSNAQQPFVMPDGKYLVYSSDRAGGQGGFDLWYSELDITGNPGTPVNMGNTINTKFDEQAASYHLPSKTFIFSSNGRVGMGGFDFFYSKGDINNFAPPQNFGYPVNSVKDDLYFASKGSARNVLENVLLSSDRDAACCLELFSLIKKKPLKTIEGTVVACETKIPLAGVSVSFVDPATNQVIVEKTTDASGSYSFTLEEYQLIKATATLSGYFTNSLRFNSPDEIEADMLVNPAICLTVIPEAPITVENVYYDFNKSTLKDESFPALDKLVTLLNDNPTMQIELSAHTDSKGSDEYNLALSDARAKSVVDYLIGKGVTPARLIAKGYGEAAPVADNSNVDGTDNPEGRQMNRRTEFKVLKN